MLRYYVFSPMRQDWRSVEVVEMEDLHYTCISKNQCPKHSVDLHVTDG